jgi:hypothetical protein
MPAIMGRAEQHSKDLLNKLGRKIERTLGKLSRELAEAAQTKAPTPDDEYRELNAPSGEEPLVPRAGRRSADTDGRVRFRKPAGTQYIFDALVDPRNTEKSQSETIFGAKVGNRDFLDSQCRFEYVNLMREGKDSHVAMGPYTVFYGFDMFESGIAAFTVTPRFKGDQWEYPLRPGEAPEDETWSMTKSVRPYFMFLGNGALPEVAAAVLSAAMAEFGPGHAS